MWFFKTALTGTVINSSDWSVAIVPPDSGSITPSAAGVEMLKPRQAKLRTKAYRAGAA